MIGPLRRQKSKKMAVFLASLQIEVRDHFGGMAERVSELAYIALIRTRSRKFKKYLRERRKLNAGHRARPYQFACNPCSNMGRSMGEDVRLKVEPGCPVKRRA